MAIWHRELAANPDTNILGATDNPSQPYIIANRPPKVLAAHLAWWAWTHFGAMLIAAAGALVVSGVVG